MAASRVKRALIESLMSVAVLSLCLPCVGQSVPENKPQPEPVCRCLHYINRGREGGIPRVGGGVSAPKLISSTRPQYTEEARRLGLQGSVVLFAEVDEEGCVMFPRVVRHLGAGLDEQAVEAVKCWRYAPGKKDGEPVPVEMDIEVKFQLSADK